MLRTVRPSGRRIRQSDFIEQGGPARAFVRSGAFKVTLFPRSLSTGERFEKRRAWTPDYVAAQRLSYNREHGKPFDWRVHLDMST